MNSKVIKVTIKEDVLEVLNDERVLASIFLMTNIKADTIYRWIKAGDYDKLLYYPVLLAIGHILSRDVYELVDVEM
jgi:hypothetical protein